MDRFQAMQAFTRIVELGAFGKAADSLELPRASVTQAIQQLEAHLGVQLLQRTTRQVSLTLDGQAYYERCVRLLADLEEAESCFPRVLNNPRGRLRVDLPGALGRMRVIPFLPEFCERYPELELQLSSNDRLVDLLREGADCVLRVGELHDSSLVGGDLADVTLENFAGKRKVLNIFPSVDTPTCATSVRKFNVEAGKLANTVVLCISADLPFAQKRFCGAEGLENVVNLSTLRGREFLENYGVAIASGPLAGLAARAVVVLDEQNKVLHSELVGEIADEPNYAAALAAL